MRYNTESQITTDDTSGAAAVKTSQLIFLKSTQKSVSIYGLSIRGYENAKKY